MIWEKSGEKDAKRGNWCDVLRDIVEALSNALKAEAAYVFIHECFRPLCFFSLGRREPQWEVAGQVALKALEEGRILSLDSSSQEEGSESLWLGIPLMDGDRALGVIGLLLPPAPPLSSRELDLLEAMGHQLVVSVLTPRMCERAQLDKRRLRAQIEELIQRLKAGEKRPPEEGKGSFYDEQPYGPCAIALKMQERERERIAHDLHDGVIQLLIGALYEAQAAKERIASGTPAVQENLDKVQALLHRAEREMRHIIYNLHPPILELKGLIPAIKEYARTFTNLYDIRCSVEVKGAPYRLSPEEEVAIYRIVQEALRNVELHSQATSATITLAFHPASLEVVITDNGRGFDYEAFLRNPAGHLGIKGMKERARRIGGELEVVSQVGKGTKIVLRVPAKG